ncbi:MAG: S8 family serine peptidase [Nanobdellota archaeon]
MRIRFIFTIVILSFCGFALEESVPLINGPEVWSLNYTGKGTSVCVIDTGIYHHPDFEDRIIAEKCYCKSSSEPDLTRDSCCPNGNDTDENASDDNGHGTHVAGAVAANGGVQGVAPDANLVVIKTLNSTGAGLTSDIIAGIDWCVANKDTYNISVISMSLGLNRIYGGFCDNETIARSANEAVNEDLFVVAASGNDGRNSGMRAPACASNVTSVGATYDISDQNGYDHKVCYDSSIEVDNITCFSNLDGSLTKSDGKGYPAPDILAPGAFTTSPVPPGNCAECHASTYRELAGTSMATPHVAGAAAVLVEAFNDLYGRYPTPQELRRIINESMVTIVPDANRTKLWSNPNATFKRIDLLSALQSIDNEAPLVNLTKGPNNETFDTNTFIINATVSDRLNDITGCWVYTNNSGNVSMAFANGSCTMEWSVFGSGTYFYEVHAQDANGNMGISARHTITINNTPPFISNKTPGNVTISETDNVTLSINYADENNEYLNVSWYHNSRLIRNNLTDKRRDNYTFITNYTMEGNHTISVSIDDSGFVINTSWHIIVNHTNAPPMISNSTDLWWYMKRNGSTATLVNLSDYIYDIDREALNYSVNTTDNITSVINGSIISLNSTLNWTGEGFFLINASDGKDSLRVNFSVSVYDDYDNDSYLPVVLGGSDCDDFNASINPGAEDICGNGIDEDCSGRDLACPEPVDDSSSGSSGSSGGGGGYIKPDHYTRYFSTVRPYVRYDGTIYTDSIVEAYAFKTSAYERKINLAIRDLDRSTLNHTLQNAYAFFSIDHGMTSMILGIITVRVDKSFIERFDLRAYKKKKNITWKQVEIDLWREDNKSIYYNITTGGFSTFALTGVRAPKQVNMTSTNNTNTTNGSNTTNMTQTKPSVDPSLEKAQQVPPRRDERIYMFFKRLTEGFVISFITTIIIVLYVFRRGGYFDDLRSLEQEIATHLYHGHAEEHILDHYHGRGYKKEHLMKRIEKARIIAGLKHLEEYVLEKLKAGYHEHHIIQELVGQGWHPRHVKHSTRNALKRSNK